MNTVSQRTFWAYSVKFDLKFSITLSIISRVPCQLGGGLFIPPLIALVYPVPAPQHSEVHAHAQSPRDFLRPLRRLWVWHLFRRRGTTHLGVVIVSQWAHHVLARVREWGRT